MSNIKKKFVSNIIIVFLIFTILLNIPIGNFGEIDEIDKPVTNSTRSVIIVGPGQNHTNIQSVINNATSGDIIRLYAGTYNEYIRVNRTISIIGNGSSDTIIKGFGPYSTVQVKNDSCNITGLSITGSQLGHTGLYIESNYNKIIDCSIYGNDNTGIRISRGNGNLLENFTCNNNKYWGVSINKESNNNILKNGSVYNNPDSGISVYGLDNVIENCETYNNGGGIGLSNRGVIRNSTSFLNNGSGIYVSDSIVENVNCYNNNGYGIYSSNSIVNNATCSKNYYSGISSASNSLITNSECSYNYGNGIKCNTNSIIRNTTCNYNMENGIEVPCSSFNQIENCTSNWNNLAGIDLDAAQYNTISYCNISSNNGSGIILSRSDYNTISYCNGNRNKGKFVYLDRSKSNTIVHNNIENNTGYGVCISSLTDYNKIWYNSFIKNNNNGTQAADEGTGNRWNYKNEGNYWSDWVEPDSEPDGIVDMPYIIPGWSNARDNYPLTYPYGVLRFYYPNNNTAYENLEYNESCYVRYSSDPVIWSCSTNASWLRFSAPANLSGTPTPSDIGEYWVNITASYGSNNTFKNFTLEVLNINDPPNITTNDVESCFQYEHYYVDYDATDVDPTNDTFIWDLKTDASFLFLETNTGVLNGTLSQSDVGIYWVNISVIDGKGGLDFHNFTLEVKNVNDAPTGNNKTLEILEDTKKEVFNLNNMFEDIDGDELEFIFSGQLNLEINLSDSFLRIYPPPNWNGWENITVKALDGEYNCSAILSILVLPVNDPPSSITIEGIDNFTLAYPTTIDLTSVVLDVDLEFEGDDYSYVWTSNISGILGINQSLYNLVLSPGYHWITVNATDKEGKWVQDYIIVVVEEEKGSNGDDDDNGNDGNTIMTFLALALILLPLLIVILLFGDIMLKTRAEEVSEEDEIEEEDERELDIEE